MTTIELAAIVAGYAMAFARVANAARWGWTWLPPWAQVLIPPTVTAIPTLVEQLTAVQSKGDLSVALVVFLGALGTAWRGTHPPPPPPSSSDGKAVGLATSMLAALALLVGCAATQERPPCDEASYAHLALTCGDDEAACDRQISERETFCAKQIQGEP